MMKDFSLVVLCIIGCVACTRSPHLEQKSASAQAPVRIIATIYPLADWASHVGGKRVTVSTLLPAGSSAHTFEPSPKEMRQIESNQLFVQAGLHLDDWGARLAGAAPSGMKTLDIGDQLLKQGKLPELPEPGQEIAPGAGERRQGHEHEEGRNPHFWLDPVMAQDSVDLICNALIEVDSASAADYRANAQTYKAQLGQLSSELSATLGQCRNRSFVSFHNAYAYLAQRYGLHVAAVIEEYPGKTPSDRYIRELVDQLRQQKITTVFAEPQFDPRAAQIIANETRGRVDMLDPYGDRSFPDRNTYIKLMEFNGEKLRKALCE